MTIKLMWRDKEMRQQVFSMLLIIGIITVFWVFLYVGISSEVERRSDIPQKTKRVWMQEKALNQWETEQRMATVPVQNKPELMKAMQAVSK